MKRENSNIKKTEDNLYSRERQEQPIIGDFQKREFEVQEDWNQEDPSRTNLQKVISNKNKKMTTKKILVGSLIFLVIAIAFALYIMFNGSNVSSAENIEMTVEGPVSVGSGDKISLRIAIDNKNTSNLESVELFIDLPSGSKGTLDGGEKTSRITKSLGTIEPNALINEKIDAEFFGEEKEIKTVFVTLEYSFEGSGATLEKKVERTVQITSSPVSFTIDMLDEAYSNQQVDMIVSIKSDTPETVEGLLFDMVYPFGFTFSSAEPAPTYGNNVWVLPTLEPFGAQEIHIRGNVKGEDDNSKVFTASLGGQDPNDPKSIGTIFSSNEESIIIKRPFIGLKVLIDGKDASDYVVIDGKEKVTVTIPWVNNLDSKIIGAIIEVKLNHDIVDRSSIKLLSSKGFYRSVDDTIVWNQQTNPELGVVSPRATDVVGFTFELLPIVSNGQLFKNVEIGIGATAEGTRLSDMNVPQKIETPVVGKARLLSAVTLSSKALYYEGALKNTGAMPPQINKETTYTIVWQLTNGTNNLSNAIVRATLPAYITWKNVVSPNGEKINYDAQKGEITWTAGKVEAGTGISKAPKEVAFQVGFIPSITQVGSSPALINSTILNAADDFTGQFVNDAEDSKSIELTADPYYKKEQGVVAK